MITQLQTNLEYIHSEIMDKLIPENIKAGIEILNIEGTYEGSGGGTITTNILDISEEPVSINNTTLIFDSSSEVPILRNGVLYEPQGITVNTEGVTLSNGEYISSQALNGKGLYIDNNTGNTKTFNVKVIFETGSPHCYIQYGYGTGTVSEMISTGQGRESYAGSFYSADTPIVITYSVPNEKRFFIGFGENDYPHISRIFIS